MDVVTVDFSLEKCGNRLHKQNNTDDMANVGNVDCNNDDLTHKITPLADNNHLILILMVVRSQKELAVEYFFSSQDWVLTISYRKRNEIYWQQVVRCA